MKLGPLGLHGLEDGDEGLDEVAVDGGAVGQALVDRGEAVVVQDLQLLEKGRLARLAGAQEQDADLGQGLERLERVLVGQALLVLGRTQQISVVEAASRMVDLKGNFKA